jgi:hypothetical protein
MLETLIAASLVLVPLFLALPMLAKYLDLRTHAVQAARYAAWERTIHFGGDAASKLGWFGTPNAWIANEKSDGEIKAEIATRLLSNTNATNKFARSDASNSAFATGRQKLLWQDRNGTGLLDYAQVTGQASQACDPSGDFMNAITGYDCAPGTLNKVLAPIAAVAATLGPFTLELGGKYQATFSLNPAWIRDSSFLIDSTLARKPMQERAVVLGNGWTADGPSKEDKTSVKQQVKGLTPTSILNTEVGGVNIMNIVQTVLSIWAPELSPRKLELGKIEPDEVPADRLKP